MARPSAETRITTRDQLLKPTPDRREACLVHIYPTGPNIGCRYPLGDRPLILGRDDDCDVRMADDSVSRRHARVDLAESGYKVADLRSTNGTYVNETITHGAQLLRDGDYLRVGNCIYRFLSGGNLELEYHEEIYRLTIIDGLTQVHNRRYLNEFLDRELARSRRHSCPLSVMLFDLDHFKAINDDLGHLGGDYVLRELAAAVKATVRQEDLFARYGGEEFALVLVETPHAAALDAAERVRSLVARSRLRFDDQPVPVTVSVGVASTVGNPPLKASDLLGLADVRLYEAKRAGRNRVAGDSSR